MNYDVVFHVDLADEKIFMLALSNVLNFYNDPKSANAKVVMLANGPAVNLFVQGKTPNELDLAIEKGLNVKLCQNALNKFELKKEDLIPKHQIVPAGITELIELQNNGFSYIKP